MSDRTTFLVGSGAPGTGAGVIASVRAGDDGVEVVDRFATGEVTFLAEHPRGSAVYATVGTEAGSELLTLRVDEESGLELVHSAPCGPAGTGHVTVTSDGRFVVVAGYRTHDVTAFAIDDDGAARERRGNVAFTGSGPHADRQESAHPHQVVEQEGTLLVPDLGSDRLRHVAIDEDGGLREIESWAVPPGSGPRHVLPHRGMLLLVAELSGELLWSADPASGWSSSPSSRAGEGQAPSAIVLLDDDTVLVGNRGAGVLSVWDVSMGMPRHLRDLDSGPTWPRDVVVRDGFVLVANSWDNQLCGLATRGSDGDIRWRLEWEHPCSLLAVTGVIP